VGQIATHLLAMFDIDAKSWVMIVAVTGLAFWILRNAANALQLLFFLPLAAIFSVATNYVLVLLHVYQPAKLADWMVWIIAAATVGNLIAIALVVLCSGADEASATASKQ
jgi:hypothetical protein